MNKASLNGATRRLVMTAMLSAASVVLSFLNFPIAFFAPPFIKFDFSDLPALIASFSMGTVPGITVSFVKNFIHFLLGSNTGGVGELSNFFLSATFVTVAGLVYRRRKTRRAALVGSILGAFCMASIGILTNYFIVYPIYYTVGWPKEAILGMYQAIFPFVDNILECLLVSNFPFTLVKGLASTALCFLVYKRMSFFIKGIAPPHKKEQPHAPADMKTEEEREGQ